MLTVFAVPAHPNVLPDGAEATRLVCAACSFCGVCSITLSSWLQSDRNPTPPAEAEQSRCQLPAAAPADHRTLSSLNQHKCILLLSGSRISFPAFRCRRTRSFWRLSGALVCPLPVRLLVFPGLWPLPPPSTRITPVSLSSLSSNSPLPVISRTLVITLGATWRIQENLPISGSLTEAHLPSPFFHMSFQGLGRGRLYSADQGQGALVSVTAEPGD